MWISIFHYRYERNAAAIGPQTRSHSKDDTGIVAWAGAD